MMMMMGRMCRLLSPLLMVLSCVSSIQISIDGRRMLVDNEEQYWKGVSWNPVPRGGVHPPSMNDFLHFVNIDGPKMREAGVNIVRTYTPITDKTVIRKLFGYGIYLINTVDPLATSDQQRDMINDLKDEEGIVMWSLGNEWNYNGLYVHRSHEECIRTIQAAALRIKEVDTTRPVMSVYGEHLTAATVDALSAIDVWGLNIYRFDSFGTLFEEYARVSSKPMFLTEFGADAWNANTNQLDLESQAYATERLMGEIAVNHVVAPGGVCMGGLIFTWADEWWKDAGGDAWVHDVGGVAPGGGPYPDRTFNEEYWGLSAIERNYENCLTTSTTAGCSLRPAYYAFKNAPVPISTADPGCMGPFVSYPACESRIQFLLNNPTLYPAYIAYGINSEDRCLAQQFVYEEGQHHCPPITSTSTPITTTSPTTRPTSSPSQSPTTANLNCEGPFVSYPACESRIQFLLNNPTLYPAYIAYGINSEDRCLAQQFVYEEGQHRCPPVRSFVFGRR